MTEPASSTKLSSISKPRQPKRRRWLFALLAIGLSTLVAIVIAEVGIRLCMDQEGKRLATYDSALGWRGWPNGRGIYARKHDNIRVAFRYNNLGFRDEDVLPKREGQQRILMLGDSFIENLEVEYEKTFPALFEAHVRGRNADWDVAAVGSQGYSTAQELIAFRKFRQEVAPDVVLLCFYSGNDYDDNLRRQFAYLDDDGNLQLPENSDPGWKRSAKWLQRWLYESSHLVYLTKNAIQYATQIELAPSSKNADDLGEEYKRDITKKLVGQIDLEAKEHGAAFGVLAMPYRDDIKDGNRAPTETIVQYCREQGIPCLDMWDVFEFEDFFETDIHFNIQGHEKAAIAIDRFVAETFLAPSDGTEEASEKVASGSQTTPHSLSR